MNADEFKYICDEILYFLILNKYFLYFAFVTRAVELIGEVTDSDS